MTRQGQIPPPVRQFRPRAMALAASTGGPAALERVLCDFCADLRSQGQTLGDVPPIFVTQHLSAPFNGLLAQRLGAACGLECREAAMGQEIGSGCVYVAPDGAHLAVRRWGADSCRIRLMQTPPVHFCRPAADPMLESLAAAYGENLLAVILTGMGKDGMKGCQMVAAAGGSVWVQDAQSSVVWGMPGAVVQSGLACRVLPLGAIGAALAECVRAGGGS